MSKRTLVWFIPGLALLALAPWLQAHQDHAQPGGSGNSDTFENCLIQCEPLPLCITDGMSCGNYMVCNTSPADSGSRIEVTATWDSDGDPTTIEMQRTWSLRPGQCTRMRCDIIDIVAHERGADNGCVSLTEYHD